MREGVLRRYGDCPEMAGERKGFCNRCGSALTGRRLMWCSDECRNWAYENHSWGFARHAAIKRSCVFDIRSREQQGAVCCGCEKVAYPWQHDFEVDHIERAHGLHAELSCRHHLANLRLLCRTCHKAVTAQQRADDARARRRSLVSQEGLL